MYTSVGERRGREDCWGQGAVEEGIGDGGERWCVGKDNKGERVRRRDARTSRQGACKRKNVSCADRGSWCGREKREGLKGGCESV
jgi:hypothetical protein